MKKYLFLTSLLFVSCHSELEIKAEKEKKDKLNKEWFQHPQTVGTLSDGRVIQRVCFQDPFEYPHWIYFVGNDMTINHLEQHGKTTENHVEVLIDGIKYGPEKDLDKSTNDK